MNRLSLCLAFLSLWLPAAAPRAEQSQEFPSRILVTAVTTEDGAGNDLRSPSGIFYDRHSGEIVVAATGSSRISIFDQNLISRYSVIHFVTDSLSRKSLQGEPRSVATLSTGDILVIDNLSKYIDILDFRGSPVAHLLPAELAGDKNLKLRATAVTVDESDNVYISVTGDMEAVLMLDADFGLKRKIGQKGSGPQEFSTIMALYASKGKLYVTDLYGFPAIKIFDTSGAFLTGFAGHAQDAKDLSMPSGIGVVQDTLGVPLVLVTDALRHAVKAYTEGGELVSIIGGYGGGIGEWQYPSGLAISTNNTFFVLERGTGRIQKVEIRPPK